MINISKNPDVVENVFIGAECSQDDIYQYMTLFNEFWDVFYWLYEEIPHVDPKTVQHDIQTYENVKPVRKKL
jgi:hypothetical protein